MSNSLLSMVAAAMFATQTASNQPTLPEKNTAAVMTLTGCINRGSGTSSDMSTGARLSGFDGRKDGRQRGEMTVGTGSRRVTIRGGLVPSPNVAAQAGALDPERVAVAARTAGTQRGMGTAPLPEFRGAHLQAIGGPCP